MRAWAFRFAWVQLGALGTLMSRALPLLMLTRDEFFEQNSVRSQGVHALTLEQGRQFVAEGEQAARFEADDGYSPCDIRRKRIHRALHFTARFIDQSDRQEGAAAA